MGLIGKNKTTEQIRKGLLGTIARIYLFKINNGNARTMYDIMFKVNNRDTKKTSLYLFSFFIVKFVVLHIVLVFPSLSLNK